MKPINQTRNWSTCLHGWTLPKNSLYGFIHGKEFVCINANIETPAGFRVKIWNPGKSAWQDRHTKDKHGDIYVRIRDFKKSPEYCADNPVACHTVTLPERQKQAEAAERAKKLEQQRLERAWNEAMREIGAPQEKRPQQAIFRCKPQHGDINHEWTSGIDKDAVVFGNGYTQEERENIALRSHLRDIGYIGQDGVKFREKYGFAPIFEQGQTTCGDASERKVGEDCAPYTRSGFEVKRDGMKTRFADYHGQKPERPNVSNPYKVEKNEKTGKHYITKNGKVWEG